MYIVLLFLVASGGSYNEIWAPHHDLPSPTRADPCLFSISYVTFAHHAVATLVFFLFLNTFNRSVSTLFAAALPSTWMPCPQIFSQMAPSPHSCVSSNATFSEKLPSTMLLKHFPSSDPGSSPSYHFVSLPGHFWKLLIFLSDFACLPAKIQDLWEWVRAIDLSTAVIAECPALRTLLGSTEVFYKYVLNERMECPPTDRKLGQDWTALFCLAFAWRGLNE